MHDALCWWNERRLYVREHFYYKRMCPSSYKGSHKHYSDVIMSAMASQITSLTMVYSTVYLGADQKTSKLRATGLYEGNSPMTGEFPAQRASNAEKVFNWWRHHEICLKADIHTDVHDVEEAQHLVDPGVVTCRLAAGSWLAACEAVYLFLGSSGRGPGEVYT